MVRPGDRSTTTLPTDAAETIRRHTCYVPGSRVEWIGDRVVRIILPDGSSGDYLAPPRFYPDEYPLPTNERSSAVNRDSPERTDHQQPGHADRDGAITDTDDATGHQDTGPAGSTAPVRGLAGRGGYLQPGAGATDTDTEAYPDAFDSMFGRSTQGVRYDGVRVGRITDSERKQWTRG